MRAAGECSGAEKDCWRVLYKGGAPGQKSALDIPRVRRVSELLVEELEQTRKASR